MENSWIEESISMLMANGVRTKVIDEEHYVSLADYTEYIKGLVEQIVQITKQQQEEVMSISKMMDAFNHVLSEKYPDIKEELHILTNQRLKAS
ncbi:MAG: hypothetical protein OEZ59_07175 [Deltaproteobacteria bacterium]|nr:hypothetical protein [Deltaproteobacteria bacterium]